ncbi:MAG TPA: ABC transporter ATP-binding protein [Terriglobales bacterium]|nr:ABC transporter ATP-binding protein [Terriglobales bacterium]
MAPILEIRSISKEYRLGRAFQKTETFRELLERAATAPLRAFNGSSGESGAAKEGRFWALRDITFDVPEGEVVGIIGRNGAGKSTLLKVISRITDPTEGFIKVRGRMASLLEVGTGFHPELTGRENIFLNGAILGMRKAEIVSKFDEIVEFAEVEKFLDTPVKHYSSGMYVRLAFAVAAHLNPEILIVDEVLAVGDVAFQKKCLGKMNEVSRGGRTVLFVSHNMAAVENLCRRGVVLERGKLVFDGPAKDAVHRYLNSLAGAQNADGHIVDLSGASDRRSMAGKYLEKIEFYTEGDRPLIEGLQVGARLKVRVHFDLPAPTSSFNLGLGFNNIFGQRIFTAHSMLEPNRTNQEHHGPQVFVCDIPSLTLMPGEYTLRLWLDIGNAEADLINDAARLSVIEADYYGTGKIPPAGAIVLKHRWYLEKAADA